MDLDYHLMQEIVEVDLILKVLEEGYRKKYFRKDTAKPWSFKCYHCENKVASNEADEFWSVPVTNYSLNVSVRRFCTKDCSDCYFNEQRNELIAQREQFIEDRKLLGSFYKEAEQKFQEAIAGRSQMIGGRV